jgi:hypothetical protein
VENLISWVRILRGKIDLFLPPIAIFVEGQVAVLLSSYSGGRLTDFCLGERVQAHREY